MNSKELRENATKNSEGTENERTFNDSIAKIEFRSVPIPSKYTTQMYLFVITFTAFQRVR